MKIVLAFDSFKGALSAPEVCAAASAGLARLSPAPEVVACPLSDGGEGFADALRVAGGGQALPFQVTGPLFETVRAEVIFFEHHRRALIESARACGLGLVPPDRRSPLRTTSYGVGEMLRAAYAVGARELVVGLGGSSTNDAGLGLLAALGWRFLDAGGQEVPPVGASLGLVTRIEPGETLPDAEITVACDVCNPLYGPEGAARVYAPQKGASPEDVAALDAGLAHFAAVCAETLGHDDAAKPGAGAAGGLGFAFLACLHAHFQPGAEVAIETARLADHLRGADLCVTGEGQTDYQTAYGKLPAAVAACCRRAGVPCVCLSGALGERWREAYAAGFTAMLSTSQRPQTLENAMADTAATLADAAEAVGRLAATLRKE